MHQWGSLVAHGRCRCAFSAPAMPTLPHGVRLATVRQPVVVLTVFAVGLQSRVASSWQLRLEALPVSTLCSFPPSAPAHTLHIHPYFGTLFFSSFG